jgi:hypothetical protein
MNWYSAPMEDGRGMHEIAAANLDAWKRSGVVRTLSSWGLGRVKTLRRGEHVDRSRGIKLHDWTGFFCPRSERRPTECALAVFQSGRSVPHVASERENHPREHELMRCEHDVDWKNRLHTWNIDHAEHTEPQFLLNATFGRERESDAGLHQSLLGC